MIPIVSKQFRYIFFYNPKSACSVARKLFLELHREELNHEQTQSLRQLREAHQDEWHNVSSLFPYDESLNASLDYKGYSKLTLVRHPATRIISAYLNRVVLNQTDQDDIKAVLKYKGHNNQERFAFADFLDYLSFQLSGEGSQNGGLKKLENRHFLPQSSLHGPLQDHQLCSPFHRKLAPSKAKVKQLFGQSTPPVLKLNHIAKIENLNADLISAYNVIFNNDPKKLANVEKTLNQLPIHNATFVSDDIDEEAVVLSADQLRQRGKMPNYDSFLNADIINRIYQLYAEDFLLFNYNKVPNQQSRQFEKQKNKQINDMVPNDFDWQFYVNANADLLHGGINNKALAINHWIHHGRFEKRQYKP